MGTAQIAEQIGLYHLFVGIQRRLVESAHRTDAGVVDPDVDAPFSECGRSAGQRLHGLVEGDVGRHGQGFTAPLPAFLDGFLQRFRVTRR